MAWSREKAVRNSNTPEEAQFSARDKRKFLVNGMSKDIVGGEERGGSLTGPPSLRGSGSQTLHYTDLVLLCRGSLYLYADSQNTANSFPSLQIKLHRGEVQVYLSRGMLSEFLLTSFLYKCSKGGDSRPWPNHDDREIPILREPEVGVLADEDWGAPLNSQPVL